MTIAEALQTWLSAWDEKPAEVTLDALDGRGGAIAITIQPLSETTIRAYVNGSRLVEYQFAVYCRVKALNDQDRAAAFGVLESLGEWAKTADLPDLSPARTAERVKQVSAPLLIARQAGADDFQSVFTIMYSEVR
jgi:hypothetical protein